MDGLDIRILRELMGGLISESFPPNAQSLRAVARKLEVDKETIRHRISSLQKKGILVGWRTMVNPQVLSMEVTRIWHDFSSEDAKEDGIRKLSMVPNVRTIYNYLGNSVSFVLVRRKSNAREPSDGMTLPVAIGTSFVATLRFPRSSLVMTERDWRIYRSIRDDSNKAQRVVSKETGVPPRTLKRRLSTLSREKAFLFFPDLQPGSMDGVASELLVRFSGGEGAEESILALADDCVVRVESYVEPCVLFSLVTPNVRRAQNISKNVRAVVGVKEARLDILQGVIQSRSPMNM